MRQIRSFQASAARFASILGRRDGVRVIFTGTGAATDSKLHIQLPALPAGTLMTPWQELVFGGYLDHETSHIRSKTLMEWKGKPTFDRIKEPLKAFVRNVIEDIRIEIAHIHRYPGSQRYLDAVEKHCGELVRADPPKDSPYQRALSLFYKEAWAKHRGVYGGDQQDWLVDDPKLKPIADLMDEGMPRLRNSEDSYKLADKVAEFFEEQFSEEERKQQGGGRPDLGQLMTSMMQAMGAGQSSQELGQAAAELMEKMDRGEVMMALMKEIMEDNDAAAEAAMPKNQRGGDGSNQRGSKILPPAGTSQDRIFVPSERDRDAYLSARNSAMPVVTATKKMLNLYLRTRTSQAWSRGLEEGSLDVTQLHGLIATGNRRIMKEKRTREMIDTAVGLVLDCSSSMDAHLLRVTGILLAEALTGIRKLKLGVFGFATRYGHHHYPGPGGRAEPMDLLIFKDFDDNFNLSKDRLGAVGTYGCTPLGEAYGYALERLAERKEPRRVLWMLSDGAPYFSKNDHSHNDFLLMAKVNAMAKAVGVETIGMHLGTVGRGSKHPWDGYAHKIATVSSADDLPAETMRLIRGIAR